MNKSNVMEIKKTLKITPEFLPSINTICTCFVNGNKEKLISNTEGTMSLDEEEIFKYIELLKGSLSGAIGKKLINLEFTSDETSKAAQDKLLNIHQHMFQNAETRDEFFDLIINNLAFDENYLIVVGHGIYDAPVKTSDGAKLEDETNTYDFMITAICPVHSTKAGLTLDMENERMISSKQVQIVEAPVSGFLYPAFNDRETDIHSMLYFTKKPEEQHSEFIEALIGKTAPTSSAAQQHIFESILAEVTNDSAEFETIKELHGILSEKAEEAQMQSETVELGKEEIKAILQETGIPEEKLEDFDHIYERAGGNENTKFVAQNLMELDKFNVKAPDIEIKIKPDKTGLIQKRKVDGKNCIVVTLEGDIALNGIQVSDVL